MAERRAAVLAPEGPCKEAGKLAAVAAWLRREHMRVSRRQTTVPLTNHSDAEDVLQDAALRALEHCATLRLEWGRLTPWLTTTVRHLEIDELRKARREEMLLCRDVEQLQAIATPERQAESRLMLSEEQQRTLDAANALSPSFRDVFFMFHRDELSHGEIGAKLGISEEASRMRLSRAHEILRKQLGPETGEMLNKLRGRIPPFFFYDVNTAHRDSEKNRSRYDRVQRSANVCAALLAVSLAFFYVDVPHAGAGLHVPDRCLEFAQQEQPASRESIKGLNMAPLSTPAPASRHPGLRPERRHREAHQEDAGGTSFRMKRPTQSRIPFLR